MTRRELGVWALLWTLIATSVAVGIVAGFLALTALALAPRVAGDVPVAATAVPAWEFIDIQPVAGTLRPVEKPAPSPSPRAVPRLAARDSAGTPQRGQDSRPIGSTTGTNAGLDKGAPGPAIFKGTASWFDSPIGVSAAGPALRAALGPGWRGTRVTVCSGGRCAVTVLGDWCACPRRAIDLDAPVFAALAPLSQGLMEVTIEWP